MLTREIEIRKLDGVSYETLSAEERDRLDSEETLIDYRTERLEVSRPVLVDKKADLPLKPPLEIPGDSVGV